MLKERLAAADTVKAAFLPTEQSAEEVVVLGANCLLTMLQARRSAQLPIETGAEALAHVGRGVALAAEAFAQFALAHPHLRAVPAQIGISNYGTTETVAIRPFQPFVAAGQESSAQAA